MMHLDLSGFPHRNYCAVFYEVCICVGLYETFHQSEHTEAHCFKGERAMETSPFVLCWMRFSATAPWNKCDYSKLKFPVISLNFLSLPQESNNELGAAGPSGDFEIRDDRRNDLGRGIVPVDPDLIGNTVDGGSSAAQLPQKNILERKEVLIGKKNCQ